MEKKEARLIRESLNEEVITSLADKILIVYKSFGYEEFIKEIIVELHDSSLTERIDLVTDKLRKFLPQDFELAAEFILNSLPPELGALDSDLQDLYSMNGFIMVSLGNYVARYGKEHFDISMNLFYELTKRFTAEGSIRYFLIEFESETLKIFNQWVKDANLHVRRLVSESTRPRLPWTIQLKQYIENPQSIIPLLEILKNDKELYVRRSVANNLNDISKDNPELVIKLLRIWNEDKSEEMQWLIRHALRTLEKEGRFDALEILGYSRNPKIEIWDFDIENKQVEFGDSLNFSFKLKSLVQQNQKIVVDYIVHHMKANGKLSPKVFKLKKMKLGAKETVNISKQHFIKAISTRKYYKGRHELEIQINGKSYQKNSFQLIKKDPVLI